MRQRTFRTSVAIAGAIYLALALLGALAVSEIVQMEMLKRERDVIAADVIEDADRIAASLQREVIKFDTIAEAVAAVIERAPDITQDEFQRLAGRLASDTDAILAIGAAEDFRLKLLFPVEGNEAAIGLDYRTVPSQYASLQHAIETGQSILYGPVDLVQGGAGFIQRVPVQRPGADADNGTWGVVSVVIDRDRLMGSLYRGVDNGLQVALRNVDYYGPDGALLYGPATVFEGDPVIRDIRFDGGTWQLATAPSGGLPVQPAFAGQIRVGIFALFIALAALVLWLHSLYKSRQVVASQLSAAINSIQDGFALYDADDRLVFANEKYKRLYEKSRDAIFPGNTFEAILREGLANGQYEAAVGREEEWLAERLTAHRNPETPIEQELADGRWLKIAEAKTEGGNTVGFRVDVTELKRAQERAEAANKAKTEFLNVVSHELRTPLTTVIGYTRLIQNPKLLRHFKSVTEAIDAEADRDALRAALDLWTTDITSLAGRVNLSGEHLLNLINDLLDRARLDAGKISIEAKELSLQKLVGDVVAKLEFKAQEKNLVLVQDVPDIVFEGDEFRLRQVLINIVGNALKFTTAGQVNISARMSANALRIEVADTGCGMNELDQSRIFEKFVQVDSSATRSNSGAGLGLAISRDIVALHGGRIEVDSAPGEGSRFTIVLPNEAKDLHLVA